MSNIEDCKTVEELRAYSMQDLQSLYSKMTKTHAPKFSDKGVAAKRILPMLEQRRKEWTLTQVPPPNDLRGIIKVKKPRGRPSGQLSNRVYRFDFDTYDKHRRQLAPQARQIIDQLEQDVYTESELQTAVKVKTKQDPWRIFQYYRPKMIGLKILKLENPHEEVA
jgi:hypothetical protein